MTLAQRGDDASRFDPSLAARVDEVCDRFEEAWCKGQQPRIEDYLTGVPEAEGRALLPELIALEVHYRRRAGEDPQAPDYRQRFPAVETTYLEAAVRAAQPGALSQARTLSPGSAAAGEWPGVPGYEILGLLGRGGMGVVYQARDQRLHRLVALKMLLAGTPADPEDLHRFRTEAEAQARLQHPNIVQIYEVGEAQGRPYFALEYVEGGSLAQQLAGKPQSAAVAAELLEILARAVHCAHQQGVVHRDLKPLNVLLTTAGVPKITDFGLAKRLEANTARTRSGLVLGTPSYMAPEQAAGEIKRIGPATDVYALGVVLYEALTGRPPFLSESTLQTMLLVRSQEPVSPRRLQPKVPRDLETICLKCLQKEPARRYPSAEALAEDLRRFRAGEPIRARPVSPVERLGRWCRRNPALAAAAGLASAALVAVTIISLLFALYYARAEERAATDLRQSKLLSAEKTFGQGTLLCKQGDIALGMLWFARGLEEAPAGSDDLQRLLRANLAGWRRQLHPLRDCLAHDDKVRAVAVSKDNQTVATACGHVSWLWREGKGFALQGHADQVRAVAFSPDGTLVLTGSFDGTAQLWKTATGEKWGAPFIHDQGKAIWCVAFNPNDGRQVLTAGAGGLLRLWDVEGKREPIQSLVGHRRKLIQAAVFSPDGTRILTGGRDLTAQLWDVATGKEIGRPLAHEHWVLSAAFTPDGREVLTGGHDGRAILWDLDRRERLLSLSHNGPVMAVAINGDGRTLLTGCGNCAAQLWDVAGQPLGAPFRHNDWIMSVALSPDGQSAWTASLDGSSRRWDLTRLSDPVAYLKHQNWILTVAFSPDGQLILTGDRNGVAQLWTAQGEPLGDCLRSHKGPIRALAFSPNGRSFATASVDKTVCIWDVQTCLAKMDPAERRCRLTLKHQSTVHAVAFSPDNRVILTGSEGGKDGGKARLWNADNGKLLRDPIPHSRNVTAAAFGPQGNIFVTGEGGKVARLWDTATGKPLGKLFLHSTAVTSVAFSPDGRILLTGDETGTVRRWDVATGQLLSSLLRGAWIRSPLAFRSDGRLLLTGSQGTTAQLWDAATTKPFGPPLPHAAPVLAVAFRPDGRMALTGCMDGKARLWKTWAPIEGEVERVGLWVQVLAGMELSAGGEVVVLDAATWQARRQHLEELGGPPLP